MPESIGNDAIVPYEYQGIMWALPNIGDNVTTENASVAELFEVINKNLLVLTNQRDCFVSNPPSVECTKNHHNTFVRLIRFIDARTKADNEPRLDFAHINSVKRVFKRYPVRYFDQVNRWTRRWTELYLFGLSNIAQMAEANTWSNDWGIISGREMKKPFVEAYRLMCIELFNIPPESFTVISGGDEKPQFYLTDSDFAGYSPSKLIPSYEYLEQPYTGFFTEDALAALSKTNVQVDDGVVAAQTAVVDGRGNIVQ